jgi:hypothetical protein
VHSLERAGRKVGVSVGEIEEKRKKERFSLALNSEWKEDGGEIN